ncbi:hypothetical protein [Streptomyces luteocolor]|uniref:hypothetical protein n=1 Tax=Streptomyces luteocolor TaxID=285500 RepID=UPI00114CB0CE|nr:hypothetical protein [Streptomyces luteocolor]
MSSIVPVDSQSLLRFLQKWHGEPNSPTSKSATPNLAPEALIHWHEISSQWSDGITFHNYAIPLPELEIEDGKVPFWVENQGTWLWSFDPHDPNHPVYEKEPSSDSAPWVATGEKLSDFLVHATVFEAVLGAPATKVAFGISDDFLWVRDETRPLPFPAWNWPAPGSRIAIGEDWLALMHPSDAPAAGYDVTLAATAPEHLTWAENASGIEWTSYSSSENVTADEPLPW